MKLTKERDSSKIKIFLEWAALLICFILSLVLCLPFFFPQILNFALRSKGIDFVKCPIRQVVFFKFSSPQCVFSFPIVGGRVQITANELEFAYKKNTLLPILNLASLNIELPESLRASSDKKNSFSDLNFPLSEFHLKKGSLQIGKNLIAEFSADLFDLSKSNYGSAKINLTPINLQEDTLFKSYLKKFKLPLELHKGTVDLDADLSIKDFNLGQDSVVTINILNLSGIYNKLEFNNLNISNLSFTGYPIWGNKKPANVNIQNIQTNVGIPFEKIQFKFIMNKTTNETSNIAIDAVKANILGGQIFSKHIDIENSKLLPFIIDLKAIDLSLLLGLSGKSLTGTGKISGKLPIDFVEQKLSVKNGFMQALAPGGELQYAPSAEASETAKQNQDTSLALRALEQFYYDQMKVKLQYNKNGALLANISLQGINKKILNGRKIHFNINVEENIPSLLKSLRLATQIKKENWVN